MNSQTKYGKYRKIKEVAGVVISIRKKDDGPDTHIESGPSVIDDFLEEGWEIVEIVSHHSSQHDYTGLVFILGWPTSRRSEPPSTHKISTRKTKKR